MDTKIAALIRHGKKQNTKEMQRSAEEFDPGEIRPLVTKYILKDDFPQVLGFFLDGLTQSGQSQILRYKVSEELLLALEKCDLPLSKANSITSRLKLEVTNFPSSHLVKLCDLCVKIICEHAANEAQNSGTHSHMCWKELLPSMLSLLLESRKIMQHGTQLTGEEYKSQLVKTLIQAAWKPEVASSLAGMFINIPLSNEEHLQVVNKMCSHMKDILPQDLPILVHNMLDLCKDRHGLLLLMKLNHYFHNRLYSSRHQQSKIPSTQMLDSDNIEGDITEETKQAQCTVLYHINKVAGSYTSIKEFVNVMGRIARGMPEAVLQPVLVSVLFCIATVTTYEEQVFHILKSAIIRSVIETKKRCDSTWMREIRVNDVDVGELIRTLIDCSKDGQLGAEEGLVNLAFELLRVQPKKEITSERLWYYGTFILLRLMRLQRHVANSVLQRLCDCIIIGEGVHQYIKCLGQMCKEMRLVIIEQQNIIIGLLSYLRVIPWGVARDIVHAVLPIVLHAPSVRDNLILVLRKALFSREVNTRKMAVHGFVEILKNMRLETGSLGHLTQGPSSSTFSGYNFLSQVSVEVHSQVPISNTNTKEAICLEVLGALRGCLAQQADVRACLYRGFAEVVHSNSILTGSILFWLREHFTKQCQLDVLPPLCFDSIVLCQGSDAVLQEPLGALINVVQRVTEVALNRKEEVDSRTLTQISEILDKLINAMGRCQPENFGLDEDTRLMDQSFDNRKAGEILQQALGVYEALMCYCMNTWSLETPEQGATIITLHKCYSRLVDFAKSSVTGGAKKDQLGTQGKSQKGRPARSSFKLPSTVAGLPFICRALDLLNMDEVAWATTPASSSVKGKRDFHRYVIGVVNQFVANLKEELQSGNQSALKTCSKLGRKVYYHCISRLSDINAFDRTLPVVVLESFLELLQIVQMYCKPKWTVFLQEITQVHASDGVGEQLKPLLSKLHSLLTENINEDDDSNDEAMDKKVLQLLASAYSLLALELPTDSPQCAQVLEQVRSICCNNSTNNVALVRILLQLLLGLTVRKKAESHLLITLAKQLQIEVGILPDTSAEDVPDGNRFAILNSVSKYAVLAVVCSGIKGRLEEVNWMTTRLEAHFSMLSFSPDEDTLEISRELLKTTEREVVCHMARCIQSAVSLSICAPEPGQHADVLLRLNIDVFDTLTHLTKYFTKRSSKENKVFEQARFDKVIKSAGKQLARNMFSLIVYIGDKKNEGKKTKKTSDPAYRRTLVLRETRLIPLLVKRKEMFDQCVIKLSKDCKAPYLVEIIKHNSARDFSSIKPQAIRQALEDITDDTQNSQPAPCSPDKNESGNESGDNTNDQEHSNDGEDEDLIPGSDTEDDEQPASKKAKRTV